jgi:hypothetical protein
MEDTPDSVQLLKGRRDADGELPAAYIGQSTRSNYCAVYSTGMLLSLMGRRVTRQYALRLFDLKRSNPEYAGASHFDIGRIFARELPVTAWCWDYHEVFDFALASKLIRRHLQKTGCPTLISFRIVHKKRKWKAKHVAVATGATENLIQLLDPLAGKPRGCSRANVWLQKEAGLKTIRVVGGSYGVDGGSETAVMRWSFVPKTIKSR